MRTLTLPLLALITILSLGTGCTPVSGSLWSTPMPGDTTQLVGSWQKVTDSVCSRLYPNLLQFRENGLYFGQMDAQGGYTLWDAGAYQVIEAGTLELSTANDALVRYRFWLADERLMFVDANGCRFEYQRTI